MRYRISDKIKCENDFEIVFCHQAVVSVIISKIHIWKKVAHEKWPPPLFEKWSFGTLFSILSFLHRVGQLLFYGLMGSKFRRQERPNYVREQLWGYREECERAIKRERDLTEVKWVMRRWQQCFKKRLRAENSLSFHYLRANGLGHLLFHRNFSLFLGCGGPHLPIYS